MLGCGNAPTDSEPGNSKLSISTTFRGFLDNLTVDNADKISDRYGEVTASLNKKFRDTESKTGRKTAIQGISDLDMLYIMPKRMWSDYKDGRQYKLLSDTKDAIKARYPKTTVFVDRLVVCVQYTNFHIRPALKIED
jgi:Second Messenger Oligonucleotide or Dinucleotide Synthetase domain